MEPTLELPQSSASQGSEHVRSAVPSRICLITIGGELFAIDLRHVREVFELESITPVPGMPASLVGVANLRGTVVPLADLRPSLGVASSAAPKYAVVVRHGAQQVGILIDDVPEIRTIHQDDMLAASTRGVTDGRPFLSGLVKIENRMSGMVEVSRLLASVEGTMN
ncbi:MAG TPA: chemotaxis protein CheW [Nitrospiraceae bacterium]|nr:chemotaxis protein CheW [Nitrospiraceae bacterium]